MSTFSSLRLLAPLCGALLLASAPLALAQENQQDGAGETANQYPAPPQTPEAAGERFYQFLSSVSVGGGQAPGMASNWTRARIYLDSLARAQLSAVSSRPQDGGLERLFSVMAQQKDEPQFKGEVVGTQGDETLVEVAPAPAKKRAVIVIAEDGGFRVDVKATYGRWNDLSGEKLDIAWADYTGIVSPALAKNVAYIENTRRSSCQSNLKQQMLGILQYSQDYDEKFPTARKWIDEIMPYVKSEAIFRCPALAAASNYGYAFNQNLDGLSMAKMDNVAQTIAIYETDDLTRSAFGVGDERAYRHLDGSNIAFADGHIKWYRKGAEPKESVSFKP